MVVEREKLPATLPRFGRVNPDEIRFSPFGIAIKNIQGDFVCVKDGGIMSVSGFTLHGILYKIPLNQSDIRVGDIIMHSTYPVAVKEVKPKRLVVINLYTGEESTILLTKDIFNTVTKIVSLI